MSTTVQTPQGPSVEGAGPALLAELLPEFEARLLDSGVPVNQSLNEGLEPDIVRERLQRIGLTAPEELVVWFGWRNGTKNPLQPGGAPMVLPFTDPVDLELAIKNYEYHRVRHASIWSWAERWISIESAPHSLNVLCAGYELAPVLVRKANEDFPLAGSQSEYQSVSLSTLVTWWIDAIDSGVTKWDVESRQWKTNILGLPAIQLASGMYY